jgi:iron complex transport system substrate-binding protein
MTIIIIYSLWKLIIYEGRLLMKGIKACLKVLVAPVLVTLSFSAISQESSQEQRIVSAGGSITEILYALGASQNIVATDTSSLFPVQATELPQIGYYRQLSTEGVLAMRPTSVYAARGAGPYEVIKQLKNAGIDVQVFEQEISVIGLLELINQLGEKTAKELEAKALSTRIREQLSNLQKGNTGQHEKTVFLMSANDRGLMAAGKNTVPQLIMKIAGIDNPYANIEGFKPVSIESFLSISPQHVLMAAHQSGGMTPQQLCKLPALKQWAITQGCNLHIVDSLLFLGLTPRLPQAVNELLTIVGKNNLDQQTALVRASSSE